MKKYACVLKMVEPEVGLLKKDILAIKDMLGDSEDGYIPLDLESTNGNTCAIGFIDTSIYEELDFEEKNLLKVLGPVLEDMKKENDLCEYELPNGYIAYMGYNLPKNLQENKIKKYHITMKADLIFQNKENEDNINLEERALSYLNNASKNMVSPFNYNILTKEFEKTNNVVKEMSFTVELNFKIESTESEYHVRNKVLETLYFIENLSNKFLTISILESTTL